MGTLQHSLMVQGLQILTDGDERSAKALGQVTNENPAVVAQQFQNFPAALLIEHLGFSTGRVSFCFLLTFSNFAAKVHKRRVGLSFGYDFVPSTSRRGDKI